MFFCWIHLIFAREPLILLVLKSWVHVYIYDQNVCSVLLFNAWEVFVCNLVICWLYINYSYWTGESWNWKIWTRETFLQQIYDTHVGYILSRTLVIGTTINTSSTYYTWFWPTFFPRQVDKVNMINFNTIYSSPLFFHLPNWWEISQIDEVNIINFNIIHLFSIFLFFLISLIFPKSMRYLIIFPGQRDSSLRYMMLRFRSMRWENMFSADFLGPKQQPADTLKKMKYLTTCRYEFL